MADRRRTASGFSLVEVIITLVILSILATGVLGTLFYGKRAMESGQQKMIAAHLLESKIALFRSKGAKALSPTLAPQTYAEEELHNGLISWEILAPEEGNEYWKEAKISVGWDSRASAPVVHDTVSQCQWSRTIVAFFSEG